MKAKGKYKPLLLRSINNVLEFGKHKGETIAQVMKSDPNWIHWALQNIPEFKLNRNALLLLPPEQKVTRVDPWDESDFHREAQHQRDYGVDPY